MARRPVLQEIEEAPEADRLDGFLHPRHTQRVIGHEASERTLAGGIASGRLHHGWLFSGPEGIGKATLAYAFIRALLVKPVERDPTGATLSVVGTPIACRQLAALSHPDFLLLRRSWDAKSKRATTAIAVDEVRRLRAFLGHTVEPGAWRAVLVDTADDLNASAANALLKSLEEPPPRTVFILLTSEPGRLLPTIRSRCRLLPCVPLAAADLKAAVLQAIAAGDGGTVPDPGDWPKLTAVANGSVRRALAVSSTGGLKLFEKAQGLIERLPRIDWAEAHALSDELAGAAAEQKFDQFFEFLGDRIAHLVGVAAVGTNDASDGRLAARLVAPGRLAAFASAWSEINAAKAQARALNLDRKSLILETIARLAAAAERG